MIILVRRWGEVLFAYLRASCTQMFSYVLCAFRRMLACAYEKCADLGENHPLSDQSCKLMLSSFQEYQLCFENRGNKMVVNPAFASELVRRKQERIDFAVREVGGR